MPSTILGIPVLSKADLADLDAGQGGWIGRTE
jgi:hypothetical protein